jgi:hypothetical protein
MTPDEVQANIIQIVHRRAKARPVVRDLEIAAGQAKAEFERQFALAKANADGSVAEREAHAHSVCETVRKQMIDATAQFNYAKGLLADLADDQMAWQSVLKNILSEIG